MTASGYGIFTGLAENMARFQELEQTMQILANDPARATPPPASTEALRLASKELEAAFLAVMLRETGAGAPRTAMGGGIGEEQFASFLTDIYAQKMVDAGGIGLAESIFRALSGGRP
jgi:peptidoglycan hydrolase FlgJ